MAKTGRITEAAQRRLAGVGQRWTPARQAIVASLERAAAPVTVPDLCEDSGVALSSAYRNLAILEQARIAHRVSEGEHARFELAEDLSDHHHHHLICTSCGAVEDFEPSAALEQRAADALARAARQQGWSIEGHRLDVIGRCPSCR